MSSTVFIQEQNVIGAVNIHTQNLTGFVQEPNTQTAVSEAYEAGKQSEYNKFWDNFQENGNRYSYSYAFYYAGWFDELWKPKYKIYPGIAISMYEGCSVADYDLRNINIDFSRSTNLNRAFREFRGLVATGIINTTKAENIQQLFYLCSNLKTTSIVVGGKNTSFGSVFYNCTSLENLTVSGTIAINGFNVQYSPNLTHDSLMSIINCLADKTTDTSGTTWKVTLGVDNIAKLTEDEIAQAEAKGWMIA